MKNTKLIIVAFLLMLLSSSCAVIDSILPNGIKYHTVVKYNYSDTLTIKKDRFVAKLLIQNDSLYIWANYLPSQSKNKKLKAGKASDAINLERSVPLTYIFSK